MADQLSSTSSIAALLNPDTRQRDAVLKALYCDPKVRNKVSQWLQQYNKVRLEADDIIQEAILLLYDNVLDGQFRQESKLTTFLLGICLNLIRNDGRKIKRIDYRQELVPNVAIEENQADMNIVSQELTEAEEQRDNLLKEAMSQLKENCREALRLQYTQAYSMIKIAEARGLKNAQQAKKLASRCRQYLRKIITDNPRFNRYLGVNPI